MSPEIAPLPSDHKAEELQRAFHAFNKVSEELTNAYEALQGRVSSLTQELAVANGALRRQFEEKEALSERLALLLHALPAGVIVLDGEGRVTEANPVACAMFGPALVGLSWDEIMRGTLEPALAVGEWVMQGGRHLSVAESALDSSGGKILLIHDVTLAHKMKADLERNQRLAAMGEMAASLAHQLRTPLAAALLYTANLGQSALTDEARRRFSDKATGQLRRLERLIQDVLLFARGESLGRDVIVVSELLLELAQTMEPLMREQKIDFACWDEAPGAVLVGSRKALFGAVVSLLENALQATPAKGKVCLFAARQENEVRIAVRDSGPGIGAEFQARIFEPFFTTRSQGTGLGLPIALGVARAHGGKLELESQSGQGAEFSLLLPLAPPRDEIKT